MPQPRSLGRRLLAGAALFIALALLVAGGVIGLLLHHFIQRQVDERLDSQILFLASKLQADDSGALRLTGNADGPPFDRPARGWHWQVKGPTNVLRSRWLEPGTLDVAGLPPPRPPRRPPPPGMDGPPPWPWEGPGPEGRPLHYRIKTVTIGKAQAEIVATAPREAVTGPLLDAMTTLGLSLAALGVALVLAMLLQVRLGLRPLHRLRDALAEVRAGRADRVPGEQPEEVRPLVGELNALLEQNAANLERARRHVSNLAHGLKTPLATLSVALSREPARDPELVDMVDTMERRIRHHLGRARAAALGGPTRAQTGVAGRLEGLGQVLAKVTGERRIALTLDVPPALAVACEQQDFDEIAGNLLENAFKWARAAVAVQATPGDGAVVTLIIDDDGPGLRAEQIAQVLQPGKRLDESAPGFGFGLSITQELVELYGGSLDFGRAPLGGLRVTLKLPSPR